MDISNTRSGMASEMRTLFVAGVAIAVLVFSTGCATTIPGVTAISPTANPNTEVADFVSDLQTATETDIDVLAPTWFGRADKSLKEAQKTLSKGGAVQSILQNVAEGRASLAQAETFAQVSRQTLPTAIKARSDARKAEGDTLGDGYRAAEKRFLELTAAVESDNLNWARRTAPEVEKAFRSVELAGIKRQSIDRIADLLEKAKEAGAGKYARPELADVEKRYADLDRFVSQNRYAGEATSERAAEVLFYTNRLVYLTEEAKRIEKESAPQLALENEEFLASLAEKLELPDLRNQSQRAQKRQIENAIEKSLGTRHDLQARLDVLRTELEKQQGNLEALRSVSELEAERMAALERERQFNLLIAAVSSTFAPGEAEVYKKGSQLVIRVRSINFPVGSAVVLPDSYPVLAKVQRAIMSFDQPRVVVEGHTDSTGSTEVNDRLSQQRADAVVSYLVNNETIPASRVSAVGMGFSAPLASDRTAEGRAENRRIDVLINPGSDELGPRANVAAGP